VTSAHRVLWGEGMFLRPQHFQQQSLYQEWLLGNIVAHYHAYPAGIKQLLIDESALAIGSLRLERMSGILPDGTAVNIPVNDPAPPVRSLGDIPNLGTESLIYLALPEINAYGGNSLEPGHTATRPARYSVESKTSPDLYTSALEADLSVLTHKTVLLTESENRDGYHAIAIGRIKLTPSGTWSLDNQFVPPLLDISSNEVMIGILRRLIDMLFVKSQALAGRHRERAKNIAEYSTSDIASFWLLHTVNRNFPKLNHLLKTPLVHPEQFYLALAELNGELLTFSSNASLREIPAYRHDDLFTVFTQLEKSIHTLLDTVISSRYQVIPLTSARPSIYVGQLASDNLLENVDFYLSIESQQPAVRVIETVPMKIKVGSPEDVEKILNSALPGVRLSHANQTPGAIPVRIGNVYFALEPGSLIYDRMLSARSICLYVPNTLQDIKIELIAVFR
jgi:type VI secretion system protein ImpJ